VRWTHPEAIGAASSRWGARVWLAGLLVAAQLAAGAHFAFVQHRLCAVHGKLVHVKRGAKSAVLAGRPGATMQSTRQMADLAHDHCTCPASGGETFVLASHGQDGAHSPRPAVACGVPVVNVLAQPIALLALAPKSSPPT
jgi:hypothetical protein